jgi:hypothetical protein
VCHKIIIEDKKSREARGKEGVVFLSSESTCDLYMMYIHFFDFFFNFQQSGRYNLLGELTFKVLV